MTARGRKKKGVLVVVLLVVLAGGLFLGVTKLEPLEPLVQQVQQMIFFEEVTIEKSELKNCFYYEQLNKEERRAYQELLQGIRKQSEEIYVHLADGRRAMALYQMVLDDFPELFWCESSVSARYNDNPDLFFNYSVLKPTYLYGDAERKKRQKKIDAAVKECLAGVPEDADDYEKVRYVYQYVINQTDYVETASDNQNIYSVFANWESVCAGYARASQYLLQRMGVFCIYVYGETVDTKGKRGAHAWNIVECEGVYYQMDATWGDPTYLTVTPRQENEIFYDYLFCTDEELGKTHTPTADIDYPACTDQSYNYYIQNDQYYENFSSETAMAKMRNDIDAARPSTIFKFATKELYKEALNRLRGDLQESAAEYLCAQYQLDTVSYYSEAVENLWVIRLYWEYTDSNQEQIKESD